MPGPHEESCRPHVLGCLRRTLRRPIADAAFGMVCSESQQSRRTRGARLDSKLGPQIEVAVGALAEETSWVLPGQKIRVDGGWLRAARRLAERESEETGPGSVRTGDP